MPSSGTITYADTLYFFALLNAIQNAREVIEIAVFLFRTDYEGETQAQAYPGYQTVRT